MRPDKKGTSFMKKNETRSDRTITSFPCHAQTAFIVAEEYQSNPTDGLSEEEAKRRLKEYGPNKIEEKKKAPFFIKFLRQFKEPMVIVLLLASFISFGIFLVNGFINISQGASFFLSKDGRENTEYIDGIVILAIIFLNAIIGAIEEQKSEQSLNALKKLSSPICKVKREGKTLLIKSEDVVIGDIVILEEGDIPPADIRLSFSLGLKSDESSLTGESLPVEKDAEIVLKEDTLIAERSNIVYSGCPISQGRGQGIVIHTGMESEVGKIASMLNDGKDDETPLQKKLSRLSRQLGLICLGIVIITFLSGLIWVLVKANRNGYENLSKEILSLFEEAIALAVAAIPEGLSAIVTIALALGVTKMVKANTIVRKLPSVETLGSVNVVCSDKTGTLTQNRMAVRKIYLDGKIIDAEDVDKKASLFLAKGMMLCTNASIKDDRIGDPTEIALLDFARTFGMGKEETEKQERRLDELPFDSVRKMMSVENECQGRKIIYTKGALDSVLKHTTRIQEKGVIRKITAEDINRINIANKKLAGSGYRILAFGYRFHDTDEKMKEEDIIFVGFVSLIDPERKEAAPAVKKLREAGIRTVMITGDHQDTAFAIAKNLDIANDISECCSGDELSSMTQEDLRRRVQTANVFSRVSPQDKVNIVKALKEEGNIVSMTGDGVNDAPSLKAADIGIAMGINGTDVAKSAADMVLSDDNFASIEKAVEEGKSIYSNIKKTIFYLLSSNFGEVLVMFFTLLLGFPTPLETLQILWINLITDSLPAISLCMSAKEKDIMKQQPRNPKDGIFSHGGFIFTLGYGTLIFLITFAAYLIPGILAFSGSKASFALQINESFERSYQGFIACLENEAVHRQCTTFAFCALGLSQIFHMLGMCDIKQSFLHLFKERNIMVYISFFLGLALQIFVTEVPGITDVFSTISLSFLEWMILISLSVIPLVVHEMLVPFFKKHDHLRII